MVINISSPNTPGLRRLQQKDALTVLVKHCQAERDKLQSERWGLPKETVFGAFEDVNHSSQSEHKHADSLEVISSVPNPVNGSLRSHGHRRTAGGARNHHVKQIPLLIKVRHCVYRTLIFICIASLLGLNDIYLLFRLLQI